MQITREADYAIRTMLEVATQPWGVPTTTMQVSRRRLVPRPFVRKIVRRLTAAGLIRTRRGNSGGLLLARQASEISLLAVIDAANSPIAINRCVLRPETCALQPTCPVHEVCCLARDQLVQIFGGVNLSELVQRGAKLKADPTDGGRLQHADVSREHQEDSSEGMIRWPNGRKRRGATGSPDLRQASN